MVVSAERKCAEARARADVDLSRMPAATMSDLDEQEQSPESLLMGAVSSEGARERLAVHALARQIAGDAGERRRWHGVDERAVHRGDRDFVETGASYHLPQLSARERA